MHYQNSSRHSTKQASWYQSTPRHMHYQSIPRDIQLSKLVDRAQRLTKSFEFIEVFRFLTLHNSSADEQAKQMRKPVSQSDSEFYFIVSYHCTTLLQMSKQMRQSVWNHSLNFIVSWHCITLLQMSKQMRQSVCIWNH